MKTVFYAVAILIGSIVLSKPGDVKAQSQEPRFEIGVHFVGMTQKFKTTKFVICSGCTIVDVGAWENGVGGRFSVSLHKYVSIDSEINYFPQDDQTLLGVRQFFSQPGNGKEIQALFGPKIGKRWSRIGAFGKTRIGFMRFSDVRQCPGDLNSCAELPKTEFAVDLGGVFEYYLSRRLLLRTDVGDTLIRFSGRRIVEVFDPPIGAQSAIVGKETRHNLQVSVGVGFRF